MSKTSDDADGFFGYEWVDDHISVEPDVGDRLQLADTTLRLAMMAVLGPRAVNEAKCSEWTTRIEALGLEWDTRPRTVTMPADKIKKALDRVIDMRRRRRATKNQLQQLLGSLRPVSTCCRAARPFY